MLSRYPPRPVEPAALPQPRGQLSEAVLDGLRRGPAVVPVAVPEDTEPYGEDVQLALYCCYELHYRGFGRVPDEREWDPVLLATRAAMERLFLDALRCDVPGGGDIPGRRFDDDVDAELAGLLVEPLDSPGVSHHLRRNGELWQMREYVVMRSLYHLKDADPQAFVIARLDGPAKAALVPT
ncbi:hypothetical protein BH24ACT9_BH24ACT9_01080 [soil metagenome]